MAASNVPVACIQMRVESDRDRNLETAERLVREAVADGAVLVALPEVFHWRGPLTEHRSHAEALDGVSVDRMAALSAELGVTLVCGSILEEPGNPAALPFNTTVVLGPAGTTLAAYRKVHLFDIEIPGRVIERESERLQAGDTAVCVDTPVGRLGLSICYDLRFPEHYRTLVQSGAEILLVPAAFTATTGEAHWETLLRARAIENQCFVLAPAQCGPVCSGPEAWGHSMIVDPWGEVLDCREEGEGVVAALFDREQLRRVRSELPCLEHVREAV